LCLAALAVGTLSGCDWIKGKGKKPKPPVTLTETAVVVRNFDADLESRFSFAKTIGKILTTAGVQDNAVNREALVKTMFLSFNSNQFTNPLSGLPMVVQQRPGDATISPADLLNPASPDGLKPIGLFNRLDLAPADWSDCGEHRIVYAAAGKLIFLIFEAKLPNPNPAAGKQGCRAVAQRWADASNAAVNQRNKLLDEFYYTGLPGFRSVVDFLNYGSFLGQVRTNILGQGPWQLREFRVLPVTTGQIAFLPGPVASNPLSGFYRDNPIGIPLEQSERAAFQSQFQAVYQNNLRSIDETDPAATTDAQFRRKLINGLGAGFEFRFNEFQSNAQGGNEMPATAAGTAIKAAIPDTWTSPVGSRTIAEAELLNRAGAITCGGCHGLSAGKPIGTFNSAPITWPNVAPSGFVHISVQKDGAGNHVISQALTDFFIPFRKAVTEDILNTTTAMLQPVNLITRLASLLVPQANAQPAPPPRDQERAPSREQVENAALDLIRGRQRAPEEGARIAASVRRASDLAHAREQVTPGAYVEFRRPH
jgi:hypothetical protein